MLNILSSDHINIIILPKEKNYIDKKLSGVKEKNFQH